VSGTGCHCEVLDQVAACSLKSAMPKPIDGRQMMLKTVQMMHNTNNTTNFAASRMNASTLRTVNNFKLCPVRLGFDEECYGYYGFCLAASEVISRKYNFEV